ncbi:MAG: hypothetical protein ABIP44_02380 [Pseudoxanthomonas sp.]
MSATKSIKSVNVTAFRDNLKDYLEVAEKEILIINGKNGKRFIITPLNDNEESFNKTISKLNSKINKNDISNG